MNNNKILIIGLSHLGYRVKKLAEEAGYIVDQVDSSELDKIKSLDLSFFSKIYLLDNRDDRNLEMVISLTSVDENLSITASMFNENIAPHLEAAYNDVSILNPAKIAAPVFVEALYQPVNRNKQYSTVSNRDQKKPVKTDKLLRGLLISFIAIISLTTVYFHFSENISWINSFYFVVVTVATVGYGDINLMNSSLLSKIVDIGLILSSTIFIWMIFSLTVDRLINKRVQLALGRKKYKYKNHVILCGLGRLGYFIAEELIKKGEKVVIIEINENSTNIEFFRSKKIDVYIGNAQLPQVLKDVNIKEAKAVISVINDDYTNIEIGLNARSFVPNMRIILRVFDDDTAKKIKKGLDIHLTLSMSAVADDVFFKTINR